MTIHAVRILGFLDDNPATISAPTSGSDVGTQDTVSVNAGDVVAVPNAVGDLLGVQFTLYTVGDTWWPVDPQPTAGDLIVVVGRIGDIPDWQVGMLWVVDEDGVAYMANAGHLASVI